MFIFKELAGSPIPLQFSQEREINEKPDYHLTDQ